jgi:hypothetical protein
MLTILICLARILFPNWAAYMTELEARAAIFAVALFAFLLTRLCFDDPRHSERASARVSSRGRDRAGGWGRPKRA